MQTTTMIDIWTWSAIGRPGQVREFPLQTFPSPHQTKWPEEICQTSDNNLDKSNPSSAATTSLSKGDVHSGCLLHSQINHHIIRNEEASCEKRHSKQSECQVSAIMSAATVPCGTRLSVNGTQCTQKNRKTFLKGKVEERRLASHLFSQNKRIGKTWVPSVPTPTIPGKTRLCGCTHSSTQHKEPSAAHRNWMPKSILDGSNPRSIDLADLKRRNPMLTQDKR